MLRYSCRSFTALSLEELYEIMALRQAVFVVEQECAYLDADGKDQQGWHVLGKNEPGEILAYTRLLPRGISYEDYASIGRVITAQKVRGTGEGRRLMEATLLHAQALWPGQTVKISAQAHLSSFYESLGFCPTGEAYLEDGIPHIGMLRTSPEWIPKKRLSQRP